MFWPSTLAGCRKITGAFLMGYVVLFGLAFTSIGLLLYVAMLYNGLVALKNDIDKAWANIDVMLKQRHDELAKLLAVCKGYMDYERDTLQKIVQARSIYQQAVTVEQEAQADQSRLAAARGPVAVEEKTRDVGAIRDCM